MSNPCTGISGNPSAGKKCAPGYVVGMLISEVKPTAIAEATAALGATYEALMLADKPNRIYPVMFDISEPSDVTITEETLSDGATIKTNEVKPSDIYRIIATECAYNTLYNEFKGGKEVYAAMLLSGNNIEFKKGATAGTVEFVKVYISASYNDAKPDATAKVNLHVQPREKYKGSVKFIGDLDFEVTSLTGVETMKFEQVGTATTTSAVISVTDCSGSDVTALTTGVGNFFAAYNVTGGASVSITGCTRSGNDYTITFAAQTAADEIVFFYEAPSTSSEKYELTQADGLSVIIPT